MVTPEEMVSLVNEYMAQPLEERDERFTAEDAARCKDMVQSFNIGTCRIFPEFPPPEFIEAVFGKGTVN